MLPIGSKTTRRIDQRSHQHTQGRKIDQRSQQFYLYKRVWSCGHFCKIEKRILTKPAGPPSKSRHATLCEHQGSATESPPDRWSERTGLLEAAVAGAQKSIGRLEKQGELHPGPFS